MTITEACTLNLNRSVKSSLSQVKALIVYQATKSLRYEGLVTNLPDRVLTSVVDSCVSLHGSERGGSLAGDVSQGVCVRLLRVARYLWQFSEGRSRGRFIGCSRISVVGWGLYLFTDSLPREWLIGLSQVKPVTPVGGSVSRLYLVRSFVKPFNNHTLLPFLLS